jgi:phytoene synthase
MGTRLKAPWTEAQWLELERETARRALGCRTEHGAWEAIQRHSRRVLSSFSTSFFIVTRFLPPAKRAQVEVTYAAVRFPDEIVDTFPLSGSERFERLRRWEDRYEQALAIAGLRDAIEAGVPSILAAWASVVRRTGIPREHYGAFLAAMRHDADPGTFATLDLLVEGYVHGSAIVVGYFLAHIYGPGRGKTTGDALAAARDLGIALQLTNFLRDVREDARRGRVYLPQDWLRRAGIRRLDLDDEAGHPAIAQVLRDLSGHAEHLYARAERQIDAFADDSRVAIQACIDVYRQLNARMGRRPDGFLRREQVPLLDKYRVLPASKYWRLPLAYIAR